jgi:hypothetical protein
LVRFFTFFGTATSSLSPPFSPSERVHRILQFPWIFFAATASFPACCRVSSVWISSKRELAPAAKVDTFIFVILVFVRDLLGCLTRGRCDSGRGISRCSSPRGSSWHMMTTGLTRCHGQRQSSSTFTSSDRLTRSGGCLDAGSGR